MKGADQPAQSDHCLRYSLYEQYNSRMQKFKLLVVSVAKQADLGMTWLQTPKTCLHVSMPIWVI